MTYLPKIAVERLASVFDNRQVPVSIPARRSDSQAFLRFRFSALKQVTTALLLIRTQLVKTPFY
jgi:hypothetical protein